MLDTRDTRMISLDGPVPDGVLKMVDESAPWDADPAGETRDISYVGGGEYSQPSKLTYAPDKPMSFYEWFGVATTRASEPVSVALTAFLLTSAKTLVDPGWTFALDADSIVKLVWEEKSRLVSISPGLAMSRAEVGASSFLAPSGAYLTWVEMLAEDFDDRGP